MLAYKQPGQNVVNHLKALREIKTILGPKQK